MGDKIIFKIKIKQLMSAIDLICWLCSDANALSDRKLFSGSSNCSSSYDRDFLYLYKVSVCSVEIFTFWQR